MKNHSVRLESEKCIGCTDCIKRCPTEAIRVQNSKAKIIEERCIDCGNCIRICKRGAKRAVTDSIEMVQNYTYRIALPAPSLYAQFPKAKNIGVILEALKEIGFTDIIEVVGAGEVITEATKEYLEEASCFPVISSSCPVIVRLIQRRFPSLINHILPIVSPMELSARYIKSVYSQKGINLEDVGVFFISPCPAKATEIHRPKGFEKSAVDGVLSMQDLYREIAKRIKQKEGKGIERQSGAEGLKWAMRNGAVEELNVSNYIAVDGLESVIEILERVEDGTLTNVKYIEALACTGGCLGGALTLESPFLSRYTLKNFIDEETKGDELVDYSIEEEMKKVPIRFEKEITPRPVFSLDKNMETALKLLEDADELYKKLPKIDCGSCGAPTCNCFAEDVVRGFSNVENCVFMLRERLKSLSEAMLELTEKVTPTKIYKNSAVKEESKEDVL